MAANKFATMLHRNTNKITLILVYAVLEWTLIILLLLNSLFSYLIIKFADYFGLKPPCPWCSRIDHFLEPRNGKNLHTDLLCEHHATEISKLGFCSDHRKLAEYQSMCEDCLSSRPDFRGVSKNCTFLPWVKEMGMIHAEEDEVIGNGEGSLNCSCCGISLEKQIYSPYVLINPSDWNYFKGPQNENLITEEGENNDQCMKEDNLDHTGSDFMIDQVNDDHGFERKSEKQMVSDANRALDSSVSVSKFGFNGLEGNEEDRVDFLLGGEGELSNEGKDSNFTMEDLVFDENVIQDLSKKYASSEMPQHLEFFIDYSGQQLVPVELMCSETEEYEIQNRVEENAKNGYHRETHLGSQLDMVARDETVLGNSCTEVSVERVMEETKSPIFESMEMEETENSLVFHAKECFSVHEQVDSNGKEHIEAVEGEEKESNFPRVSEEPSQMQINETQHEAPIEAETAASDVKEREPNVETVGEEASQNIINETEADVSIGTEIPDLNSSDEADAQDIVCLHEDTSTNCIDLFANNEHDFENKIQEETVELRALSIELSDNKMTNQTSLHSEVNGSEEEKMSDTPTSTDSFHHLHKKLLLLDRKESGTEESFDESVLSDFDDGVMTVERLTSALRAEKKALHAVYSELEEERNASAIAANQTMAMINRLQEEKASMQMEALHYQRMMEEQSEYDQEALQVLNELMVKREKEKQELENELEICRKKLLDYETKERVRMLRSSKDGSARSGFSSVSISNGEDSDDISLDLNQEAKEEDGYYSHQESGNYNTPVDGVLNFGDSFGAFEEERMSILEQLKVLEDKLFALSEDEKHYEDARHLENGIHLDGSSANGVENDYSKKINGNHYQEARVMGAKARSLLPLFDASTGEDENGIYLNGDENGILSAVTRFELEDRRAALEEEVDQLHARMHMFETDKEFLKHCFSSMKKGDKGLDLLQEILHHLRDLRNVELREKNYADGTLV